MAVIDRFKQQEEHLKEAFEQRDAFTRHLIEVINDMHKRIEALEQSYMEEKLLGKQPEDSGKIE